MAVLVTGAAGFIGMHVAERLAERGETVCGLDNFNRYYDPALKEARAARLRDRFGIEIVRADVADAETLAALIAARGVTGIIHLAAQAGVRYSLENPFAYTHSNVHGHLAVLEACRRTETVTCLVYASSSSVYGERPLTDHGFCETDPVDAPVSLYAATKRACELMSGVYARLYQMPQTGLRFFTVYGPWGRPDMAYSIFTQRILAGEPLDVFGEGRMARDFTYIDDIVDGVIGALNHPPAAGEHRIFNIGSSCPVALMDMISTLERLLGRTAKKNMLPMQDGDVRATFANIDALNALTGYRPKVPLAEGLSCYVAWRLACA